jgi:RNA polymerase sigma factor (sigma-70 family)
MSIVGAELVTPRRNLRTRIDRFLREDHAGLVKFFTSRLHCAQEARDVVQETYEWLLTHQDDPRIVTWFDPIKPLVYRVAWNIAGNRMTKRRRHARLGEQAFGVATLVAPAPEQLCAAQEDLRIIAESLNELPARCRGVFILARLEGQSFDQVARKMNITVRSVYREIDRALTYLQRRLTELPRTTA